MRLYFAGAGHIKPEAMKAYGVKNKLYSYANDKKAIQQWGNEGLMLDSGAFTVFTKGININIDELTQFVKHYKPEVAIQLDVIGDEDKTWKNYLYQKQEVDTILPVIHYKASEKHIRRVVESSDYILLGGLVPIARQRTKLVAWLDYLYSNFKLYEKKTHLLGITSRPVLSRYPAYSCDSSSWLSDNRYPADKGTQAFINQKNSNYAALEQNNVIKFLQLEKDITKLWESRGITWN